MAGGGRRGLLSALGHIAFALVWSGALISNIGNWIENVCQSWLVYDLSRSTVWSGALQFAGALPAVFLGIPMGLVADRFDRRRLLLLTQVAIAFFAAVQALAAHAGWTAPSTTVAIVFLEGIAMGAMVPVWHAYVPELVPREDLGGAIALNGIQFNAARLIGPMLAAPIIAKWGIETAFDLNVLSFALVIAALAFLRSAPRTAPRATGAWRAELGEGFRLAWRHRGIRRLIWSGAVFLFLGAPVLALLPAISVELCNGKVGTYSSLLSAMGLGAVAGGLLMGRIGAALPRQRAIALGYAFTGFTMAALAASRSQPVSLGILFLFGAGWCVTLTSQSTALQLLIPDGLRGRIMSLSFTAMMCLAPLGPLLGGLAARALTLPLALAGLGGAAVCLGVFQLVAPEPLIDAGATARILEVRPAEAAREPEPVARA